MPHHGSPVPITRTPTRVLASTSHPLPVIGDYIVQENKVVLRTQAASLDLFLFLLGRHTAYELYRLTALSQTLVLVLVLPRGVAAMLPIRRTTAPVHQHKKTNPFQKDQPLFIHRPLGSYCRYWGYHNAFRSA